MQGKMKTPSKKGELEAFTSSWGAEKMLGLDDKNAAGASVRRGCRVKFQTQILEHTAPPPPRLWKQGSTCCTSKTPDC